MTDNSDRRFSTTLARGLGILRAFRPTDAGLGNQEISERTGIPRPTVSRLTFTLCALGYLTHGRKHDKYRLGPAALALGNIAAASFSFVETAGPEMQKLANDTGTLIGIAIHDNGRMLLTKTWRPVGSASIWLEVGYRLPMLTSSTGKAYLSAVTDTEFDNLSAILTEDGTARPDAMHHLRQEAVHELQGTGFVRVPRDRHYSRTINSIAVPFRSHEFGSPVVFFSGSTYEDVTTEHFRTTIGPALARAVAGLRERSP
ncbi:IclR family transcriptional regulator [Roseovarius sp. HI0049]|nr:IclR family transcriptional regulator [Roseovarius sp. HI0049]